MTRAAAARLLGEWAGLLPPLSGPRRKVAMLLLTRLGEDRGRDALADAAELEGDPIRVLLGALTCEERRAFCRAQRAARKAKRAA